TVPRMSYSRRVVGWKVWVQLISAELHVVAEETTHGVGKIGTFQSIGNLSLQEPGLIAAVEALAFVAQAVEGLVADELGHTIGELHFTAGAALHAGEVGDDLRHQDIAPNDGKIRGRVFGCWLFYQSFYFHESSIVLADLQDAVAV